MSFGKKMFNGVLWSAVDRLSMQSAQFILGIVLARLLTPKEYGTIGLLLVFTAISKVFIESGFPLALIQKKDRSKKDLSTAFVFNIIISLICYITLYISAPYISQFYDIALLKPLLRVMAFSLVINGLYIIPSTIFAINLDFKSLAKINFSATVISGIFAIVLAYKGYGVWALAWQTILRSTIVLVIMWWFTDWKISFVFSKSSFKSLSNFGFNILISALLNRIVNDLSALFIGKIYSTKDLGIFSKGEQLSTFVSSSIGAIINRVLLPSLSALQDDLVALKNKFSQILKVTALISCPLYFGLFALAEPLVEVLLTEKWLAVVPIMRIFCVSRLITVFSALNINVLYVLGKSNLVLKQQYLAIFVRVIFVGIGLQYGIIYVAISESLATSIHLFINTYYPGKIIKYNIKEQFKNVLPFLSFSFVMLVVIYASTYYLENNTLKLIVGFITGVGSYYLLLNHFKKEQLKSIFQLIKKN